MFDNQIEITNVNKVKKKTVAIFYHRKTIMFTSEWRQRVIGLMQRVERL